MSEERKTVRVRVAVIVDGMGRWSAVGASSLGDRDAVGACYAEDLTDPLREHFIEATLPLPSAPTVEAEVKP